MDVGIYSILSSQKKILLGHKNRMQSSESSFPLPPPKKKEIKMGDEKNIHDEMAVMLT